MMMDIKSRPNDTMAVSEMESPLKMGLRCMLTVYQSSSYWIYMDGYL